ncbi:MAG TPA: murein L,D-transpeptidase [Nocardioides sp.]|nr:murein L,D-transpeptidase [Nocardioides sp.]
MPRLTVARRLALLAVCALVYLPAPAAAADAWIVDAQRRLNALHCHAGRADGTIDAWTRSAVVRFQSRHGMAQTGRLAGPVRTRLHRADARRCDLRPVPRHSGAGRRIVLSQAQNWVWLVGPKGGIVAQDGVVDLPSALGKGWHATGSYCGRAARIKRNTATSGAVWLNNFVRFAPCGIGFHQIPTYMSNGRQIHPDWYLGTNFDVSHGCIRLSRAMSLRVWNFTARRTRVRVV